MAGTKSKLPDYIVSESHRRMAADFRLFLWFMWRELRLPEPTPIQYDIAEYLQHGPRRLIVEAFRGVGKSWITAAFVLWLLWRNPEERVMVVSANAERAAAFTTFVRRLIEEIPLLHPLRPRDGQRDSIIAFDVGPSSAHQAPSVRSLGITGQLTGGRASVIVADDIEVPKNSLTEIQRERLRELVKEFDAVLTPGGRVVYLGTPQVTESLYVQLEQRGYEPRVWPVRYVGAEKYRGFLAPMLQKALAADPTLMGKSTEPGRFSEMDLAEREASYGKSGFALQFMLDTTLTEASRFPLKAGDLIVMDVNSEIAPVQLSWASGPQQVIQDLSCVGLNGDRFHSPLYVSKDWVPYQGAVMVIDPSGRGKDETTYAVVKMLKGMLYVTAWGGTLGGYDPATLEMLATVARDHKVNEVQVESNFGDGMFNALFAPVLQRIYPCTLTENRAKKQKEVRIIETLEPALNQHRIVIDKAVLKADYEQALKDQHYSGVYQLTHLSRDKGSLRHDDRVDVLASAVDYWRTSIQNDIEKAEAEHRAKAMDAELKKFMAHVLGRKPRKPTWAGF